MARQVAPNNSSYLGVLFQEEFEFYVKRDKRFVLDAYKQLRRNSVLYEQSLELQRIEKKVESFLDIPNDLSDYIFLLPANVNQSYLDYAMLEEKRQELVVIQNTVGKTHSNDLENLRVFIRALKAPIQKVSIFHMVDDLGAFTFPVPQSNLNNINELCKLVPGVEFFVGKPCYDYFSPCK
jgi:hypothetical protein